MAKLQQTQILPNGLAVKVSTLAKNKTLIYAGSQGNIDVIFVQMSEDGVNYNQVLTVNGPGSYAIPAAIEYLKAAWTPTSSGPSAAFPTGIVPVLYCSGTLQDDVGFVTTSSVNVPLALTGGLGPATLNSLLDGNIAWQETESFAGITPWVSGGVYLTGGLIKVVNTTVAGLAVGAINYWITFNGGTTSTGIVPATLQAAQTLGTSFTDGGGVIWVPVLAWQVSTGYLASSNQYVYANGSVFAPLSSGTSALTGTGPSGLNYDGTTAWNLVSALGTPSNWAPSTVYGLNTLIAVPANGGGFNYWIVTGAGTSAGGGTPGTLSGAQTLGQQYTDNSVTWTVVAIWGQNSPYLPSTAVNTNLSGPWAVTGDTVIFSTGTVTFTGSNPLSAVSIDSQISGNAGRADIVAVVLASGAVKIYSNTNTPFSITGGSAIATLGLATGTYAGGEYVLSNGNVYLCAQAGQSVANPNGPGAYIELDTLNAPAQFTALYSNGSNTDSITLQGSPDGINWADMEWDDDQSVIFSGPGQNRIVTNASVKYVGALFNRAVSGNLSLVFIENNIIAAGVNNDSMFSDNAGTTLYETPTATQDLNYITAGGAANAITGVLLDAQGNPVPLAAGLRVSVNLNTRTLQAGANTFSLNGGPAQAIRSNLNPANTIANAYAANAIVDMIYGGTVWQVASEVAASSGVFPSFGEFFGLTTGTGNGGANDYTATVAVKTSLGTGRVPFPRNGAANGVTIEAGPSTNIDQVVLPNAGIYDVWFKVHTTELGQLQLELNGTALPDSTGQDFNPTAGGHEIIGRSLVTATAGSLLAVINPTGNSTALTVTPANGSQTWANSAQIIVQQIV